MISNVKLLEPVRVEVISEKYVTTYATARARAGRPRSRLSLSAAARCRGGGGCHSGCASVDSSAAARRDGRSRSGHALARPSWPARSPRSPAALSAHKPPPFGRPPASVHTGPARPSRPLPGSQEARLRPHPPPAHSRPTAPQAAASAGAACSPPPPLAAARSGPMRHLKSRPIDPSRGAVDSGAHGPQSRACFARSARVVPLLPTPLRRATRSSPVANGRTERRKIEGAGSRHR